MRYLITLTHNYAANDSVDLPANVPHGTVGDVIERGNQFSLDTCTNVMLGVIDLLEKLPAGNVYDIRPQNISLRKMSSHIRPDHPSIEFLLSNDSPLPTARQLGHYNESDVFSGVAPFNEKRMVFAAGVILFEVMKGCPPSADSTADFGDTPALLDLKALSKKAIASNDRIATLRELARSLREISLRFGPIDDIKRKQSWGGTDLDKFQQRARRLIEELGALLEASNRQPAERAKERSFVFDEVRREIARTFEPSLNQAAQQRPHDAYEEKRELAKWINAELREFGLALKAPKTGKPSLLVGTTGHQPLVGRFVFDYVDENGKRQHPSSSATLPYLEVIPDDLTRIPYGQRSQNKR